MRRPIAAAGGGVQGRKRKVSKGSKRKRGRPCGTPKEADFSLPSSSFPLAILFSRPFPPHQDRVRRNCEQKRGQEVKEEERREKGKGKKSAKRSPYFFPSLFSPWPPPGHPAAQRVPISLQCEDRDEKTGKRGVQRSLSSSSSSSFVLISQEEPNKRREKGVLAKKSRSS